MMMSSGLGWAWNFIFMLLVLIHLSDLGIGQVDLNPYICTSTGNYTANSTYRTNLNATLAALSANTTRYGFYTASSGQGADTAYAVALCRADILPDTCRRCVQNAGIELRQVCPNQKQAIRWYEFCMLHYSNLPITGLPANDYGRGLINTREVTDPALFRQGQTALLTALSSRAANGGASIKVGAGVWNASAPEPIYALLQCIPTLSSTECNNCLNQAIQGLDYSAKGARQLRGSCNLRYELYPFYNDERLMNLNAPPLQLHSSPPGRSDSNPSKKKNDKVKIVIIVVVSFVVCLAIAGCGFFYQRKSV